MHKTGYIGIRGLSSVKQGKNQQPDVTHSEIEAEPLPFWFELI